MKHVIALFKFSQYFVPSFRSDPIVMEELAGRGWRHPGLTSSTQSSINPGRAAIVHTKDNGNIAACLYVHRCKKGIRRQTKSISCCCLQRHTRIIPVHSDKSVSRSSCYLKICSLCFKLLRADVYNYHSMYTVFASLAEVSYRHSVDRSLNTGKMDTL